MSTSERLHPAERPADHEQGKQPPETGGEYFQEPTPTTPLELAPQPASAFREFIRRRAVRAVASVVGFATAAGLIVMGSNRTEVIPGGPTGAGRGGDTPAAGPLTPGAEQNPNPEVVTGNLCDQIHLESLAEWTTGSPGAFPPEDKIACVGDVPPVQEEVIAAGTWFFYPQEDENPYPVDMIQMFVMKDRLPDGSSTFEQNRSSYGEEPHKRQIGDTEVSVMSARGTTLVQIPQPDGSAMDLRFSIVQPALGGGEPELYSGLHRGEINALPTLLPMLGLVLREQ